MISLVYVDKRLGHLLIGKVKYMAEDKSTVFVFQNLVNFEEIARSFHQAYTSYFLQSGGPGPEK